jgi:hypothetical protein
MTADNARPLLSVLCITPDGMETLAPLFRALAAQTIAKRLEIVLVAPAERVQEPLPFADDVFATVTRCIGSPGQTNPQLRSVAVRAASAPYIAFTEDHCFPEPGWADALVKALESGALGAGPVMINANPQDFVSRANFLLEYGPWSHAGAGGRVRHLPGHNSAYRRDVLVALGPKLEHVLELESPWLWQETERGATLLCVADARSHHFNFSVLGPALPLRFHGGRVFGSNRASDWSLPKRVVWAAALPLIIAIRWKRALEQAAQFMPRQSLRFHAVVPLLLTADSLGEITGYLLGAGGAMQSISGLEYHRGRFTEGVRVVPPFLDEKA